MIRTQSSTTAWQIEIFEEAASLEQANQDQWMVQENHQRIRCVVLDGVTPTAQTPRRAGIDGALWATSVTQGAFQSFDSLEHCAQAANAELHDPALWGRDQSQTCAVACDLHADGAELLLAADCQAWKLVDGEWNLIWDEDMLQPWSRAALQEWLTQHPKIDQEGKWPSGEDGVLTDVFGAERRILQDRSAWTTTPIGRFASPLLDTLSLTDFEELILATDGARLSQERLHNLPDWLHDLRDWEEQYRSVRRKWHDDLVVMRIRRNPTHERS